MWKLRRDGFDTVVMVLFHEFIDPCVIVTIEDGVLSALNEQAIGVHYLLALQAALPP